MNQLALVSTLVGGLILATRLPGLIAPTKYREHMLKFPRSMIWGRVLMGIAALIAWRVMYRAATDDWAWAQRRPLTVGFKPLRERNASTASRRRSTAPKATAWRPQASMLMPGSESTARSRSLLESKKTLLAVAPSRSASAGAPCG